MSAARTIEERFYSKVAPMMDDRGCWEWMGSLATGKWRYGKFPKGPHGSGWLQASRVSWEIHNGPIPVGMKVLHKCDNPPCVNPAHLFLGTSSDNTRDMIAKGRGNLDYAHRRASEKKYERTHCRKGHPYGEMRNGRNYCPTCRGTA